MKHSWFSILVIFVMLGLLALLATLQYQWLGQISDGERVRLEKRLQEDTKRFADDFNREISNAYFSFQLTERTWAEFRSRYQEWRSKTRYPDLIKDFYFAKGVGDEAPFRFEKQKGKFVATDWTTELSKIRERYRENYQIFTVSADNVVLVMPIYKNNGEFNQIVFRTREFRSGKITRSLKLAERHGFLVIKLDEKVIKGELLQNLSAKYFGSGGDRGSYKLSVTDHNKKMVFKNHDSAISGADVSIKLFNVLSGNVWVIRGQESPITGNKVVVEETRETGLNGGAKITDKADEIIQEIDTGPEVVDRQLHAVNADLGGSVNGFWTLEIQNTAGSLDQFIVNIRRRNIAVSFGILSLLAVSVALIFLSSQKAKALAQRQLEFVSSVSHEFRTPLSVIYSAGENLSDGVIGGQERISSYGSLIKREGKKLSAMVEQILEFAGARSGNRKYDFRELAVGKLIDVAIGEIDHLITEKGFDVEKQISPALPKIMADGRALNQALQNLIANSLKYSNGERWLKISANERDRKIEIVVEDRGIGISEKELRHVFEPFFRGANVVDEQISGNGLGLSLVKQIIEAHGGRVEVESEIDKGSKFIVHLPAIT